MLKEMFQAIMNDLENTYNIEHDIWVGVGNTLDLNLYKDDVEGWTLFAYPVENGMTVTSHEIRIF